MTGSATRAFRPDDATAVRATTVSSLATDGIPGFTAEDIERAIAPRPW